MGNTDSLPVVSQVKSLVQVIAGDEEAAKKTQENFIRTGIIASQVKIHNDIFQLCISSKYSIKKHETNANAN